MTQNPIVQLFEHKTSSSDDILKKPEETATEFDKNKYKIYEENIKILQGKRLKTKKDLKLKKDLEDNGILTIKNLVTGLEISPSSYIGSIEFSEFTIRVSPKYLMNSEKINKLLDFIWKVKPPIKIKFLESLIDVEEYDKKLLIDVIINSLIQQCKLLFKRGLLKSYIVHEEDVPFLRGKLLIRNQIQNNIKKNVKFACQYDELEQDNLENKILLAALGQSHNITNNVELKQKLRVLMHQYSMFVSNSRIGSNDFDKIVYDRLNQHYGTAHDLSRIIIEASGFREYRKEKQIKIKPFFINMDDVFEKFVEKLVRFYYSNYTKYNIEPQKTTKAWKSNSLQDKNMRTDILVTERGTKKIFILDTKYKEKLSPNDRYQIGFYIHEFNQAEGTALLPEFTGSVDDDLISAEKGIKLKLKRIDINTIIEMIDERKMDESLHDEIGKFIREDMQVPFKHF